MRPQPTGAETVLYTDVQGSARSWAAHPAARKAATERVVALDGGATEDHGVEVCRTMDGACCVACSLVLDCVRLHPHRPSAMLRMAHQSQHTVFAVTRWSRPVLACRRVHCHRDEPGGSRHLWGGCLLGGGTDEHTRSRTLDG